MAARNARAESSKAQQAFLISAATQNASNKRSRATKSAGSISSFVKQSYRELELQMAAMEAQIGLLKELSTMSDDAKMDLLFSLIDRDGGGTIDVKELAEALRKKNHGMSFTGSLERAISLVDKYDVDGDNQLDHDEFKGFVDEMLEELELSLHEFSEFLVLQMLSRGSDGKGDSCSDLSSAKDEDGNNTKPELFDILTDKRLADFFKLFDKDGSRSLSFPEVASGLYHATQHMDDIVRTTMGLLLMTEEDDKRTLGYEQFGRLIMAIVAASGCTFDDIAEDLVIALAKAKATATAENLIIGDEVYADVKEIEWVVADKQDVPDALSYARLQKLFDLWDIDGDGNLTQSELQEGLQKFLDAAGIDENATEKSAILLDFDQDFDQMLGPKEFAPAMVHYARTFTIDLHELIDFMSVSSVLGENANGFQKAYGKALVRDKEAESPPELRMLDHSSLTTVDDDLFAEDPFFGF